MPLNSDIDGVLSDFRGLARGHFSSVARSTKGRPMRVADIGARALKELDLQSGGSRDILGQNWHLIIPSNLAERCSFEQVKGGTLTISAENAAVKQQLLFVSRGILKNAQTFLPDVKKLRIL